MKHVRFAEYAQALFLRSILLVLAVAAATSTVASSASGFTWPWDSGRGWPMSSSQAVAPLDRPSLEEWIKKHDLRPGGGFRFAVLGDQRALADGEWQQLLVQLKEIAATDDRLLFLVDTGDIVQDGRHSDQFARLHEILALGPALPYLVSVGNHEVRENQAELARANTARFLSRIDPVLSPERLYYRKDVGSVRFLFLDTNDLVYGDSGTGPAPGSPPPGKPG